MAKLIGTAGHVDHGKTTLVHALTGIDPDRLPDEKLRGMTIEIGFAFLEFPSVGRVSIVDVPGHEKLVHNMLVGAMGIDLALLCVAADEGVKPQTREHLQILELLPVRTMVVALTRSDLADSEMRELSKTGVEELLVDTRFRISPVVPVSAETGEGLQDLRQTLEASLQSMDAEQARGAWYLPIDRVFSVKGHGCVVTGTLAQGNVKQGDQAVLQPGNITARVRAIHSHDEPLDVGEAGRRIALNLGGPKSEELHRGQAIGPVGTLFATKVLDAEVRWVITPKHAERIRVSIGAEEAIGKVFLSREPGEIVQIRMEKEVACARGQPLIVRRYSPPDLLGGGRVEVPQAKIRRRSEKAEVAAVGSIEVQVLGVLAQHPLGVRTEEVCRILGKSQQDLGDIFENLSAAHSAFGFAGLWLSKADWNTAGAQFVEALDRMHAVFPAKAYLPREAVVSAAKLPWSGKSLDRMISALASEAKIATSGTLVKSAAFRLALNPKQRAFLDRVKEQLDLGHASPSGPLDIAKALHVPPQAVDEVLRLGLETGELVRAHDEIFYTASTVGRIQAEMREKFGSRAFSAAEFRDAFASSRRFAIPMLEYLDKAGFTLRTGDKRAIR